jgi:hypothetical protein
MKIKIIPNKNWIIYDGEYKGELFAGVEIEIPEKFIASLETEGVVNLEQNFKVIENNEKKLTKLTTKKGS